MSLINDLMSKMSLSNKQKNEFDIVGNCFGFFNLQGGLGASTLCMELAVAASNQGLRVCIADCSPLSTFYYTKSFFVPKDDGNDASQKVPDISARLIKRTSPLKDSLMQISPNLHILCFGDMQISETFNLDIEILDKLYQELKDRFDLVIMDIPNLPWLETTISALKACSTVYCLCGFTADSISRQIKCTNYFSLAGLENILNNIVICNVPTGKTIRASLEDQMSGEVLIEVPYVTDIIKASLKGISVMNNISGKHAKQYAKVINFFLSEMLHGISGKDKVDREEETKDAHNTAGEGDEN